MRRVKVRSYFLLIIAIILALSGPITSITIFTQNSSALDDATLDIFAENNIMFYDPDEQKMPDCNSTLGSKPSGNQITWIGDSYTEDAKSKIEAKLSGVDIYYQSSKHFGKDVEGNKSGLSILRELDSNGALRDYTVFALGTNDPDGVNNSSSNYLDQVIEIIKKSSSRKLILVTPKTKASTDYSTTIQQMKSAAENTDNRDIVYIADWANSGYKDDFFTTDDSPANTHPKVGDGYQVWVDTIYNALPLSITTSGDGIVAGSDNLEKVWNYFATAGIQGVSDRTEVIAAIVGNLYGESSLDPFEYNSDGQGSYVYGLYQSYAYRSGYDPELGQKIDAAGLNKYWHKPREQSTAPEEAVNQAIKIELDHLTQSYDRFLGTGWAKNFGFINHLDNIKSGTPEGFSDLFVVAVEGAVTSAHVDDQGESNYIDDPDARAIGVASFSSQSGGGQYYQSAGRRRRFARQFYDQFKGKSGPTYTSNSSGTINCNPVNADSNDALAFLQQYVRDINYVYNQNNPIPQSSSYYNGSDPSTYTKINDSAVSADTTKLNELVSSTMNRSLASGACFGGRYCGQCTALSGWFIMTFTSYDLKQNAGVSGDGANVVNNLSVANSLSVSSTPTPWSIFSYSDGGAGHVGIVMGVDGDNIITLENNLGPRTDKNRLAIRKYNPKTTGYTYSYVDIRNGLDLSHLGATYGE